MGAGLEPARVLLPNSFQDYRLTNSAQPTFLLTKIAEGVGFEPTKGILPPTSLAVRRTRPDYATPPVIFILII